jgi:hypothetical protein
MSVSATLGTNTWLPVTLGCDVTERLLDIASDSGKSAQQRISEATAYAGTVGWDACAVFALAPDLIRHVQLRCNANQHEQLILQILDSEDGQERLQVCYISPDGDEWARIL